MEYEERPRWATASINGHTWEGANDWQYGCAWWLALATEPPLANEPPPGTGWLLNTHMGNKGRVAVTPAWSDGTIVQRRTYWRRPSLGMRSSASTYVRVNRRPWWNGSKIPARVLAEAAALDLPDQVRQD